MLRLQVGFGGGPLGLQLGDPLACFRLGVLSPAPWSRLGGVSSCLRVGVLLVLGILSVSTVLRERE
jgi:hypothetical protein